MAPLVETRWTRYGHDRVYLKTADGNQIGHIDLKSGSFTVEIEEFAEALVQCRDRWLKPTVTATAELAGRQPARFNTIRPTHDHRTARTPTGSFNQRGRRRSASETR